MNICDALPDEHFWSVVARSLQWSGYSNETIFTKKYNLKGPQIRPSKGNCKNLFKLTNYDEFKWLKVSGSSHPLWLLNFDDVESSAEELSNNQFEIARESQVKLSASWRFCCKCAEEDRAKYGSSYWHNEHNLPFVTHCTRHNIPLMHVPDLKFISSLSMPNRLKPYRTLAPSFSNEFLKWSHFVVMVYRAISNDLTSVNKFRDMVWEKLAQVPKKTSKRRPYLNLLLTDLENQVPKNLLKHCFQFYADETRRKTNILYTTYKMDGIQIRHPIYILIILYWLELESTTVFGGTYENTYINGNSAD